MPDLTVTGATADDDGICDASLFFPTGLASNNAIGNYSGYKLNAWFRFTSVTIPQGSTINSAYIEFYKYGSTGPQTINIYFHKSTNSSQPSSAADYASRTRTTATVPWNPITGVANVTVQTDSLVSIIQEITDQGGWSSGNSMTALFDCPGSATNYHLCASNDTGGGTVPKLIINYTAGGGGGGGPVTKVFTINDSFLRSTCQNLFR
jgi:hypothetical protein